MAANLELKAPNGMALYAFADGSWVVENFNDSSADVELQGRKLQIPTRDWLKQWK